MNAFIENTESRINDTVCQLMNSQDENKEGELITRLGILWRLRALYIEIKKRAHQTAL